MTRAVLRLRWQLLTMRALLWFASAGRPLAPKPEAHLYLADLHYKLAAEYERRGDRKLAWRHRGIANAHAQCGPPPDPPPSVAAVMAVPHAPQFTDARGRWFEPQPPDSA